MPDTLIKMKTGLMQDIEKDSVTGVSPVAKDAGTIYFAVSSDKKTGKILYDVDNNNRIVMSTEAEKADSADRADYADMAGSLASPVTIDGVNFDGSQNIIHYGTCSTAANVKEKTLNCGNFATLATGARIIVKFSNTNSATGPTLNVSNKGAKPIYYKGNPIPVDVQDEKSLVANGTYEFVYDASVNGGVWQYVGTIAANIGITIDDNSKTMFITSPIVNGDGVNY